MKRQPFLPKYSSTPMSMATWLIDEMPNLAQLVGRITVNWSGVDLQMALLLGSLLGVENEASVELFLWPRNNRAKRDAIDAVAKKTLPETLKRGFDAVISIHKRLDKQRNDVVHGIWGKAECTPDGIVWCSLQDHANMLIRDYYALRPDCVSRPYDRGYETMKDCFVVEYSDLEHLNSEIRLLADALGHFHAHLRYKTSVPGENALKSFQANVLVQQELERSATSQDSRKS